MSRDPITLTFMSPPPHDPYGAAVERWRSVQMRLVDTIQDYLESCAALKAALMAHPNDIVSRHLQNKAFADLDPHLPTLHVYEEHLRDARVSLHIMRNNSQGLAPINSLPPEILSIVLSLASREWVNQDHITVQQEAPVPADALASVCSLWRCQMLRSHSNWSRLELVLSGPLSESHYRRAALWAERSRSAVLHVSVREGDLESHRAVEKPRIRRAVEFLAPLMPRVRALEIALELSWSSDFVYAIVDCWVRRGSIGMAELLKIQISGRETAVALPTADTGTCYKPISLDRFEYFFRSLRTLSLGNAIIDRSLAIYSGLVDLHLGHINEGLEASLSEIAAILAASPGLQSLSIVGLGIEVPQGHVPHPVALNNLQVLSLGSGYPRNSWAVLQMITSTSEAIRMGLALEEHPEFIPAARSFFQRCKVTILHVGWSRPSLEPPVWSLFVHMPHLERLAIQNCPDPGVNWRGFIREWSVDSGSLRIWPRLRELYLTGCNPHRKVLQQLISICAPRALWVHDENLSSTHPYSDALVREQIREDLLKGGVELIWVDSREMLPIWHWEFVHSDLFAP